VRARCAIAEKLRATAPRVTVEDWEALRSLGFDEMGCLELAHIVGIFNYLTKLADGFGLELQAARSGMPLRRADGELSSLSSTSRDRHTHDNLAD